MKKIMISGTMSGCGKTTVTCAVTRALVKRGLRVSSFKCGPDYIDPMFHRRVTGTDAHNLDSFFCDDDMLRGIFARYSQDADISVAEGVMGFYDGANGAGSSHSVSQCLEMPVIAVIDAKGMSESIGAVMKGFLEYKPNHIAGFIFNRLPESLISQTKHLCDEVGTTYFGRLPKCDDISVGSRDLGLITPDEIQGLEAKADRLARLAEENIDIDRILSVDTALPVCAPAKAPYIGRTVIAVSRDEAFCFMYPENIDVITDMGAEIRYFSPLRDKELPECDALYLCGGYPELHPGFSANSSMRESVRAAVTGGMPCIAECGGFMYLHRSIDDMPAAGVIDGCSYRTDKLRRFGYITLTADTDGFVKRGTTFPAHEFHYYESDDCGSDMTADKPWKGISYRCIHSSESLFAGFPHVYLYACPDLAESFIKKSIAYGQNRTDNRT
ncbi:MAG: cobyrinate a,c-diamide synthase [Oscillospiraceae bacterium]|nr:cobyrinate a,c-diamide synthase [Oscillospiraceae bacterium]